MATTTENLYTGDGSTDLFSFTFPYISVGDVYVSIDGTDLTQLTEYILANATTIQILTPPADGSAIRIYRSTDVTDVKALFFPGSAIRARDLNDNFTQNLYVTQEATFESGAATSAAAAAAASAASAASDAQDAADKAITAEAAAVAADAKADTALAGVSTAQTAATDAQAAASTAQAAATQAAADAQEATDAVETILDAVEDGAVVSVNGQGGVVSLGLNDLTDVSTSGAGHTPADGQSLVWNESMGHWMPGVGTPKVEELADFAYYPESEQVTLVGPNVGDLSVPGVNDATYRAYQFEGTELWILYLATNTAQNAVFEQLSEGDDVTACYYIQNLQTGDPIYVELACTFKNFGPNSNSNPPQSWLQLSGAFASYNPIQGDYPMVIKSPSISNGFKPITTGQALIYDQTTDTWRPEDVSLNIGSLPTLP